MTAVSRPEPATNVMELHTGDRMTREEFHRAYEKMPPHFKAELIGGIVYVASPLKLPHGTYHLAMSGILFTYVAATPGVQSADNTTILLGSESEPQPDLLLRILPENGGQSRKIDGYVSGPPELIVEIAHSSRSLDLHAKRRDYAQYGVQEYLVVSVQEQQLHWFNLRENQENQPDANGILRMQTFPGLWINSSALFSQDSPELVRTLQEGLATSDHAAFVARLANAKPAGEARQK